MHMGDFKAVGHLHRRSKDIATADHHDFIHPALGRIGAGIAERGTQTCRQYGAPSDKAEVARQHNIGPARKQSADRLMRLAAHDERTIHCNFAEMLEIRFKTPREVSLTPYDRIVADRRNEHNFHDAVSLRGKSIGHRRKWSDGRSEKSRRKYEKRFGITRRALNHCIERLFWQFTNERTALK